MPSIDLKPVYKAIGNAEGFENALRRFYLKMSKDTMIGFFFEGKDLEKIIKNQKTFLMRSMGFEIPYHGKTPATAHLELPPILEGHFDRRLVLLRETLEELGLEKSLIDQWVAFEDQFRKIIVKK